MVDQTWRTGTGSAPGQSPGETLKSASEQAVEAGRDLKNKAADFAGATTDKLKDQATDLAGAAKDAAGQAAGKIKEAVSEKKSAGADYVGNLAETMRRASREFDNDLPIAGKYIRKAAAQVENVADSVRSGDFNDLVRNAQAFARRQPTAFLGIAALAGFATVRFLKSSADDSATTSGSSSSSSSKGYRDEYSR